MVSELLAHIKIQVAVCGFSVKLNDRVIDCMSPTTVIDRMKFYGIFNSAD